MIAIAGALRVFGSRLRTLALFGSCARGTPGPESDLDLLVVAEPLPTTFQGRLDELRPIVDGIRETMRSLGVGDDGFHRPRFLVLTPEELRAEPIFLLDLTEDARPLLDPEGLLGDALDRLRAKLRALGSRRVRTQDGTPYWVLKPGAGIGEVAEL